MVELSDRTLLEADEAIMEATYRALCQYGYVNLTIQRIADEYGKSTAAIYYYHDTKDQLLETFLDYLLEQFTDSIHDVETTDPEERLELLLDELLVKPQKNPEFSIALLEMRSQAPYKVMFSERFQQNDEYIRNVLKAVINHGINENMFNPVDVHHVTRSLITIVDSARTRAVVLDDIKAFETARRTAGEYIDAMLR